MRIILHKNTPHDALTTSGGPRTQPDENRHGRVWCDMLAWALFTEREGSDEEEGARLDMAKRRVVGHDNMLTQEDMLRVASGSTAPANYSSASSISSSEVTDNDV